MKLRHLIAAVALAAAAVLSSTSAAAALTAAPSVGAGMAAAASVSGSGWPATGATCETAGNQVSCTPTDPAENVPARCFLNVKTDSGDGTVCTTHEATAEALLATGAKEAVHEYGCGFGDAVCVTIQAWGNGLAMGTAGMMLAVVKATEFNTSGVLWDAATGQWSFWAWAVLGVVFISTVWAITAALFSRERDNVLRAIGRAAMAIAGIPLSLWAVGEVVDAFDQLVAYTVNGNGLYGMLTRLQEVMFAGGRGNYLWMYMVSLLLFIGILLILLVFSFRNIALAALIMAGPLAWMLFPAQNVGQQWVVRYFSALLTLLLTGPLTIGFLMLILDGLSALPSLWDPSTLPLLIGLMLVAFAPMAVFSLFSFAGASAVDAIGSRMGDSARRTTQSGLRSAARIPAARMGSARERAAAAARAKAAAGNPAGNAAPSPATGGAEGQAQSSAPRTRREARADRKRANKERPPTPTAGEKSAPSGSSLTSSRLDSLRRRVSPRAATPKE